MKQRNPNLRSQIVGVCSRCKKELKTSDNWNMQMYKAAGKTSAVFTHKNEEDCEQQ